MRNNNQIGGSRAVIDVVAGKVQELGDDGHKVDLKGYEKLVLVEVYRNVVGMGVLEVGGAEEWEGGLRRGNLGEVWSEGRRRLDEGRKEENKDGVKEDTGEGVTEEETEKDVNENVNEHSKASVQVSSSTEKQETDTSI